MKDSISINQKDINVDNLAKEGNEISNDGEDGDLSETNSQSLLIVNKECRSSIRTVLLQQFRSGTEEYRERADA